MTRLQIADAHVHFWDIERNYLPWLCDEPQVPFRYGDYGALRRNYLPPDYAQDAAGFEVTESVYVETEWDPRDPLGETRWVEGLIARHGVPSAMVAQAWLDRDDVAHVLESQARFPFVRGVRHKPRAPAHLLDPKWRAGFALLGRHSLSFDLQAPFTFLREAARLAADYPGTSVILNHAGLPADRSAGGIQAWKSAMKPLAACPNVAVKISGLGRRGHPWRAEDNRRIVLETIELFGVERCMFASNFPVDRLVASLGTVFAGFLEITNGLSASERRRLFRDNAVRLYRL
jgi:predicted TIM-barrel fold metal-dependent hydrolase